MIDSGVAKQLESELVLGEAANTSVINSWYFDHWMWYQIATGEMLSSSDISW